MHPRRCWYHFGTDCTARVASATGNIVRALGLAIEVAELEAEADE